MTAPVSTIAPTAAERVRSLLLAEPSLTVNINGHSAHLIGRHRVDEAGRLWLDLPADSCLALAARADPDGVVSTVEATDVAATAMRHRIRAQVTMTGWIVAGPARPGAGELVVGFDVATIDLIADESVAGVEPDEFAAARPDPLADRERTLLCHLVDAHPSSLDRLAELIEPVLLHGVRRIHALRLDRYGLVLRLEYASRDRDVRLNFARPLGDAEDAPSRLLELLSRPPVCRRRAGRSVPRRAGG